MRTKMLSALGALTCGLFLAAPMAAAAQPTRNAWPAETLSGRIMMVSPTTHLVVVKDADGVPFDLIVTNSTRIQSGNERLTIQDLKSQARKDVSIRFVPEGRGDVAQSIQVSG